MSRHPLALLGFGLAVPAGLVVALAGCFRLGVLGLVMTATAAAGAAIVAGGPSGRDGSAAARRAGTAAARTAGLLLLVAGVDALAGDVVAAVVAGLAGATLVGWWVRRARQGRPREEGPGTRSPDPSAPVHQVPTAELGQEWLRSTTVLAGPLDPAVRQSIVRRRAEALDELERRDPTGFSRWLADAGWSRSDPAAFVRIPSGPEG